MMERYFLTPRRDSERRVDETYTINMGWVYYGMMFDRVTGSTQGYSMFVTWHFAISIAVRH